MRTTVCEIFLKVLSSSQIIWRTQNCTRTHFSGLRFGTSYKSGIIIKEAQYLYTHFPQDRYCEVCLRTKMTRAPCRRRTGEALPRAEKFGDWITADHNVLKRLSPVRCRCSRSCHSMDSILSVQNKDFTKDREEFTKVSRAVRKNRKSFTLTVQWNLANLVNIYHGIIELQHAIDPRRTRLPKERYAE